MADVTSLFLYDRVCPCSLMFSLTNPKYNVDKKQIRSCSTTEEYLDVRYRPFVPDSVKKGRAVWFSNGEPRRKGKEGQKTTN